MIQYSTKVEWDAELADVGFADADDSALAGLAISGLKTTTGAPAAIADRWLPGAIVQNVFDGEAFINDGSTATPTWKLITHA